MAKLTLQQVSSILGKGAIAKLNPTTAVASGAIQAGKTASKEILGYDFAGFGPSLFPFIKIGVYAEGTTTAMSVSLIVD